MLLTVQKNFVLTLRTVEVALGVRVPGVNDNKERSNPPKNVTEAIDQAARDPSVDSEISQVLLDAIPMLLQVTKQLDLGLDVKGGANRDALVTK